MWWIKGYFKRHRLNFFLYLVFMLIFAIIFFLYKLPVEAVGYAAVLCIVFEMIVILASGWKYRKKTEELSWQIEAVKKGAERFPKPEDDQELIYQEILKNSRMQWQQEVIDLKKEKKDVIEYFTLWTHQIKTPIAAMRLLLEQEVSDIEQYYEHKKQVQAELFQIEQYVEMVLQYLRLTDSINDFLLREYELDPIIRQAVRKYAPMFIRKKLKLQYESIAVKAVTDEKWMVFVLEQLLSNAIKYTSSGTIQIYIENGCLVVEDSGMGILPEDLPRIFDKGYTGYNGRRDKKASGIGLYLVKEILNRLGHKILAESEPGKGTKMKILF